MVRIMVAIDYDSSSEKAVNRALADINTEADKLFLCAVTSNWDYLNDEKNAAKLSLYKNESYCEAKKIPCRTIQLEASDIVGEYCSTIAEFEIDVLYIARQGFRQVANQDDLVFWGFSSIKRWITGSIVDNIERRAPCKVIIVE
eukprot:TRINITY_DN4461_c0_g1_i3.p1 TRINITY_DN4461_c0_g1~~TRINITY_DN4461_c0_g1_i3.p1  ORF type:complete len:144 (+),score=10.00 TRINITY_DN4461_c0_g1_i3:151-582(+)